MTIYVVFTMTKQGGFPQEMLSAIDVALEETRKEEGCIFYNLVKDVSLPGLTEARKDVLTFIEEWKSMEALQEHLKKPYVATLLQLRKKHEIIADAKFYEKHK